MQLKLKLTNQTDKEQGPFEIWLSQNDSDEEKVVMINGLRIMVTQFGWLIETIFMWISLIYS